MFRLDGGTKKLTDACLSVSLSMVCGGFVKALLCHLQGCPIYIRRTSSC